MNRSVKTVSQLLIGLFLALTVALSGCGEKSVLDEVKRDGEVEKPKEEVVKVTTEDGSFYITFYEDRAPGHVKNFKKLVSEGFYDGLVFHRVVEGFMAQGGDPSVTGTAFEEYTIPAEISGDLRHVRGTVAAARQGDPVNPERRSSGTQFYICYGPADWLDNKYSIFGYVDEEGMKVVDKIKKGTETQRYMLGPEEATKILEMELVER